MVDQGRLYKVLLMLMVAMTAGALVLLALEGKPIKPAPYNLSSQIPLSPPSEVLGATGVKPNRWNRIEVTYLNNREQIKNLFRHDKQSRKLSDQYHFVISDGSIGKEGQIFTTNRWIRQMDCLVYAGSSKTKAKTVRICLLSTSAKNHKTAIQKHRLCVLTEYLKKFCQIQETQPF